MVPAQRRWSVYQEYSGNWVLNLSEDQTYTERATQMQGSEWQLLHDLAAGEAIERWYTLLEAERGLRHWDERDDVPGWLRQVSLVLNMHCEGWTGFAYNTFDQQLDILRWITNRIEGRRVLVYLPGWDGRYYWNYPIYQPSEQCGGSDGLRRLVQGAHELGTHVVPMFGLIASGYHNTRALGLQGTACRTSDDLEEICAWTEWDEDLATDEIWQPLNVGHAAFRQYLRDRIFWVTELKLEVGIWFPG